MYSFEVQHVTSIRKIVWKDLKNSCQIKSDSSVVCFIIFGFIRETFKNHKSTMFSQNLFPTDSEMQIPFNFSTLYIHSVALSDL